jgi:tetratricopeptide (TPR) repeat protein
VTYLRLLLWPARQALDWDVPIAAHLDAATAGAGLLLAGMVGGGVWLLARARRLPVERSGPARVAVFGTGWFFVALAPTSLVPFIDVLYEHRLYLASWGVLLALAAGASAVLGRWSSRRLRWGLIAGAAVAAGALGLATHARNAVWATKETLWADAVAKSPRKPRPHLNLGHALWLRGDNEGALAQYRLAEALDDGRMLPSNRAKLYLDMAAALGALGRYDESIEAALRGLAIDPDGPDILNNIVTSYRRKGEPQKARPFAERAVRVAPRSVEAHTALGHIRADGGDLDAALREFERAAALDPAALDPVVGAALATERLGSATDACRWWQRVARVAPTERLRSDARSRAQRIGCEKS